MQATFMERGMEQRFNEDSFPAIDPALVNIPHVYASFGSRLFQHCCMVAEKVDTSVWKSTTDAVGMTLPQAQALVTVSARFHGQLWLPLTENLPEILKRVKNATSAAGSAAVALTPSESVSVLTSRWEQRKGLAWIGYVPFFFSDKEKDLTRCPRWVPSLWATLEAFFQPSLMCVSHADCRPGNMLFSDDKCPSSEQSEPLLESSSSIQVPTTTTTTEIVMTDWEACNITPSSWDFQYSMGGFPAWERRARQRAMFELHWEALVQTLKRKNPEVEKLLAGTFLDSVELATRFKSEIHSSASHNNSARYRPINDVKDRVELEIDVIPAVSFYFGWLLHQTGNVGETQGNTEGDGKAWADRLRAVILDSFLCCCGVDSDVDGFYDSWCEPAASDKARGKCNKTCCCEDKTTMEELGIISFERGNLLSTIDPNAAFGEGRTRHVKTTGVKDGKEEEGGAVLSIADPPYHKMHLNGRILHFLEPYHKLGRECGETMKGAAKSNPKKYNRTLKEDLLDMIRYCSETGLEDHLAKTGRKSIWLGGGKLSDDNNNKSLDDKKSK